MPQMRCACFFWAHWRVRRSKSGYFYLLLTLRSRAISLASEMRFKRLLGGVFGVLDEKNILKIGRKHWEFFVKVLFYAKNLLY